MSGIVHDVRYSLRQMRKNPGFAGTAVLVLSLGMSASLAIFAFVDAALLEPLPYPNPTRLVHVTESLAMIPRANLSNPDFLDGKSQLLASYFPARRRRGLIR
jgi:macrolide transport system ATP-binding/permease protein